MRDPDVWTGYVVMLDALGARNLKAEHARHFIHHRDAIKAAVGPSRRFGKQFLTFGDTFVITLNAIDGEHAETASEIPSSPRRVFARCVGRRRVVGFMRRPPRAAA